MSEWKSTACILCECKRGIEVEFGGADGRRLVKVRGDEDRDWVAGTPWHKHTPARVEAL